MAPEPLRRRRVGGHPMIFDPDAYWRADQGVVPAVEEPSPAFDLLPDVLRSLDGPITSVLDVGCGQGRIAELLLQVFPAGQYVGIDISPSQVYATKLVRPDGNVYLSRLQDFDDDAGFDLVIASEVLMHVAPAEIQAACDKLKSLARKAVVTVDWTVPLRGEIAEWNWLHHYEALFRSVERVVPAGLQSIMVVRP